LNIKPLRPQAGREEPPDSTDDLSPDDKGWFTDAQKKTGNSPTALYNQASKKGSPQGVGPLPPAAQHQDRIYMTGNARSWVHYVDLRAAHASRKSTWTSAQACPPIFCEQFPDIARALEWKSMGGRARFFKVTNPFGSDRA